MFYDVYDLTCWYVNNLCQYFLVLHIFTLYHIFVRTFDLFLSYIYWWHFGAVALRRSNFSWRWSDVSSRHGPLLLRKNGRSRNTSWLSVCSRCGVGAGCLVSVGEHHDDIWWHMMTIDCVMHTDTSLLSTVFLQSTESTFLFCSILFYTFLSICVFSMSRLHSSGLRSAIQESSSPKAHRLRVNGPWIFRDHS